MEESIRKVLKESPFGLTTEEIAEKCHANGATIERLLNKMHVKKTKAGKTYFYSMAIIIPLFLIFILPVHAQQMDSNTYTFQTVIDNVGGSATSNSFSIATSVGQISDQQSVVSFNLCYGFLCNFLQFIVNGKVTFLLEFNVNGTANDQVYVDNNTQLKQYTSNDLTNYYACIHDTSISGSPTFGIVFSGSALNYVNISSNRSSGNSFAMRVSQDIPGNKFIVPITSGNCTVINARLPQISQYGTIIQPFATVNAVVNAIELALSYPYQQLSGSFDKTGSFTLVLEKNITNGNQIIIRPA